MSGSFLAGKSRPVGGELHYKIRKLSPDHLKIQEMPVTVRIVDTYNRKAESSIQKDR
jgi:hypothetical protein